MKQSASSPSPHYAAEACSEHIQPYSKVQTVLILLKSDKNNTRDIYTMHFNGAYVDLPLLRHVKMHHMCDSRHVLMEKSYSLHFIMLLKDQYVFQSLICFLVINPRRVN